MIRTRLSTLALASVLVLPLASAGCSKGSSPTEPAFDDELASASSLSTVTEESKGSGSGGGGSDDNSADDNDNNRRRRGRGGDDGGNDNDNNRRRGRGGRNGGNGGGNGGNDDNRPARNGREFEGSVSSVGSGSVTLAGGLRVVVNGSTQWVGRGDLFSLSEISRSLAAGNNPRVEGRGARQADGSILAATIKAEHIGD